MEDVTIPSWCKPNGWTFYLPDRTAFQSIRLQRDRQTQTYYLNDCNGRDYPLSECQELSQSHLQQPASLVIQGGSAELTPHSKGVTIRHPSKRLIVTIPDEGERAAQSLARIFNGAIATDDITD